ELTMTEAEATERLYYRDSFLREFDAQVVSCEKEGERWKIVLDRTAFYPTSGGQPYDTGRLGDVPVIEVADAEHKVVHYASAAIPVGPVHGVIDWPRRIEHMQQHTGQHLLSAAFIELFGFQTVSFHLGKEISTIDLDTPAVKAEHVEQAERRVNEVIFEDKPVVIRFGTAEELAEAGIRKKVEREGVLRAIEVEGFDRQPCGGTHLERTGQAGLLLIRKLERRRDQCRIEFVCGFRALATARGDFATLTQAASLLGCGMGEVPAVLGKWIEQRRVQHGAVKRLEERLAEHEARELLASQQSTLSGALRVIASALEDATPAYLGLLAAKLVGEANVVALLGSRASGHVVFAQTKGLPRDMGALLRDLLKQFGGKGGGAKDFAQGSVADAAKAADVVAHAKSSLVS
ncbi:MAG TPA: DHHA1 domain-containing protein, partial [Candidatus Sulfotelmatobacter sp.]|nr:DHHA1 domain-containing protein [Candidatus Sulfotelmatobacter sp.]